MKFIYIEQFKVITNHKHYETNKYQQFVRQFHF